MNPQLNIPPKLKVYKQAFPLYGKANDNPVPFWDWIKIDCDAIAADTNDAFHLRWHHLMMATQEMSEEGFSQLCSALDRPQPMTKIKLPPRPFIELWAIARKHSKEIELLRQQGELPNGIDAEESSDELDTE